MNVQGSSDCIDLVAGMTIERFGFGTLFFFCGEGGRVLAAALGALAQGW